MLVSRLVLSIIVAGLLLGGCARPPQQQSFAAPDSALPPSKIDHTATTGSIMRSALPMTAQSMPALIVPSGHLAGRTLSVATAADIQLRRGEVILTFDDGPRPGRTEAILGTLNDFGIKATFLMLGNAARAHPQSVQAVAMQGHTIGSHTYDHADLTKLTQQAATLDISRGQNAVAAALAPIGKQPAPFFRFPYLAQSGFLRTSLFHDSAVVLDVNIDSKDYFKDTPDQVIARTMARLEARGSGIILFHDIQARTVTLMPKFLKALEDRGYTVVRLMPKTNGPFGTDVITAEAPIDLRGAF